VNFPNTQEKKHIAVKVGNVITKGGEKLPLNTKVKIANNADGDTIVYKVNNHSGKYLYALNPGEYKAIYTYEGKDFFNENISVNPSSDFSVVKEIIELDVATMTAKKRTEDITKKASYTYINPADTAKRTIEELAIEKNDTAKTQQPPAIAKQVEKPQEINREEIQPIKDTAKPQETPKTQEIVKQEIVKQQDTLKSQAIVKQEIVKQETQSLQDTIKQQEVLKTQDLSRKEEEKKQMEFIAAQEKIAAQKKAEEEAFRIAIEEEKIANQREAEKTKIIEELRSERGERVKIIKEEQAAKERLAAENKIKQEQAEAANLTAKKEKEGTTEVAEATPTSSSTSSSNPLIFQEFFNYNIKEISLANARFTEFVAHIIPLISQNGTVNIAIESSASRVPTKKYGTNQKLSEFRAEEGKLKLLSALSEKGNDESKVNFVGIRPLVQGPKYKWDSKTNKSVYGKFQYIKIMSVAQDFKWAPVEREMLKSLRKIRLKTYTKEEVMSKTTDVKAVTGLIYTVQVGAFQTTIYFAKLENLPDLLYEQKENMLRIMSGKYATREDADVAKEQLIQQGFQDAFVNPYMDGEQISFRKAKKILNNKPL